MEDMARPSWIERYFLVGFDIGVRSVFHIRESGLPTHFDHRPRLIVANHRRDADIPIFGVFLGRRRGSALTGLRPHFVAREDLFDHDFLWKYWAQPWLWPLRIWAPLIPLHRILEVFRAHPMHRIPEQSLGVVLWDIHEWLGDRQIGKLVRPRLRRSFEEKGFAWNESISGILKVAATHPEFFDHPWGHRRLNLDTFRLLKPIERIRIDSALRAFEEALAKGESVVVAPEGSNSPTGFFQRPRGAPWRLVQTCPDTVEILPVGLTYDPMFGGGRLRAFVHAGEPFLANKLWTRRCFDDAISESILRALTVTVSHLASHLIIRDQERKVWDARRLAEGIKSLALQLKAASLRVSEDSITPRPIGRAERALRYLNRAGCLISIGKGRYRRNEVPFPAPGWEHASALAVYQANELASIICLNPELANAQGVSAPYVPERAGI